MTAALACEVSWAGAAAEEAAHPDRSSTGHPPAAFEIDDYFKIRIVAELSLSRDGRQLAYVTEVHSLEQNKVVREAWIVEIDAPTHPRRIAAADDGHALTWIAGTTKLAYLAGAQSGAQLRIIDSRNGTVSAITPQAQNVVRFAISPNGLRLAYTTTPQAELAQSLVEKLRDGSSGVRVDVSRTSLYHFLDASADTLSLEQTSSSTIMVKEIVSDSVRQITVPGSVRDFSWAPDSRQMAVTYVPKEARPGPMQYMRTSAAIADVNTLQLRPLAQFAAASAEHSETAFGVDAWIPHSDRLILRRTDLSDPWVAVGFPEWAVTSSSRPAEPEKLQWHGTTADSRLFPQAAERVLISTLADANPTLLEWRRGIEQRSRMIRGLEGSASQFDFSSDFSTAAFVYQRWNAPPEIFVWTSAIGKARRISALNSALASKAMEGAVAVQWLGADSTMVTGWLITPDSKAFPRPYPMITYIHGGPAWAFPNAFAPFFFIWSYPFDAFVAQGMAVFIPNYRGTHTFGRAFAAPSRTDREPVDDVIAGIRSLVSRGVADAARLGIAGHSHGAWLGPMVMTRYKHFVAGSFAEGVSNLVLNYELMPGDHRREVLDVVMGGSLYENPQRYLEGSPDMYFSGVSTATLLEAGALSLAIPMLATGNGLRRAGAPLEYVVYPNTGHGLTAPRLQRESAERNLDWFRFWLLNQEDTDIGKREQYQRWRGMRGTQGHEVSFE
jgi:dipeptidyl aminopeptidase/acylaminoacyl peptidase